MAVGCIIYQIGHAHRPSFDDLFKRMPFTCIAFIIAGLGLIGVPLTVGFISKFALIEASMDRGWWMIAVLILVSSLMAVIYVGRVVEVMLFRQSRQSTPESSGLSEAPLSMLLPMYLLIAIGLYFGINGNATLSLAGDAAKQLLGGF